MHTCKFKNRKTMKILFTWMVMAVSLWFLAACQDVTPGYLETDNAIYKPDTLVIRSELDDDPGEINPTYELYLGFGYSPDMIVNVLGIPERINEGEDYYRAKWGAPWTSVAIQGVLGTNPIYMEVRNITSQDGDPVKLKEYLSVGGNGAFEVPLEHDIPAGSYKITLNVHNEGYSHDLVDCFTIIVK